MNFAAKLAQLSSGALQRSAAAEESLALRKLISIPGNLCQLLAYDVPNGTPDCYRYLDNLIPYWFGKEWARKILNTTWLIDTSLNAFQVKVDLKDKFPIDSKIVVVPVYRNDIFHSGLDAESAAWLSGDF